MSKEAYFIAFEVLKTQNDICNTLEGIGLKFEYGDGAFGVALEQLSNQGYALLKEVLDFKVRPQSRIVNICGVEQVVTFDVFYFGDYDENFTITEDDFSDFVYTSADNFEKQNLFWKAMVDKNEDARQKFNQYAKHCQISNYWKGNN